MKSFLRLSFSTFAVLMLALVISGTQSVFAQNAIIYGVTTSNNLVSFSSAAPGTFIRNVPITGLQSDETILGIDFRPATGQLYALGSINRLYTINPATGAATQVGNAGAFTLNGTEFGFDFNPVPDRIRVVSNTRQNLRLNPNDGTLTAPDGTLTYADGDPNAAQTPNIVAAGYINNFAGTTTTTLYDIDSNLDILVTQNPPNSGTLNTVGALGIDTSDIASLDILTSADRTTNTAYAALTAPSAATTSLYTINLSTGAATQVGTVPIGGTSGPVIRSIAVAPAVSSGIVISEFRFRGALGASDEFIEIMNNGSQAVTVPAGGWALRRTNVANPPVTGTVFTIPEGTVIPARGHFLAVNSTASTGFTSSPSSGYSAGNGMTVGSGDLTYTTGVVDGGGIALFSSATIFDTTTRLDAVGFAPSTGTPDPLYREGTGLLPAGGVTTNGEYSFVRRMTSGIAQDTGDNQADFDFVFTGAPGTSINGRVPTLGAPGPERLASPIQRNGFIKGSLIFPCTDTGVDGTGCQNRNRGTTPVANGAFGTLSIRRRFTNMTGSSITTLRFRIVDVTTAPAAEGTADLRALSSSEVIIDDFAIQGTTLEMPPAQPNGGGLNSSLSCCNGSLGQVTLTNPLVSGGSIDVQFVLGVQQNGNYRFFVNVEALPANSGATAPSKTKVQRNSSKSAN
jgi:hypothetical protein